jgi:hypothetical protein
MRKFFRNKLIEFLKKGIMKQFKKVSFLLPALVAASLLSNAQTVDEVVNKHIDAIGGKDKLLALKTSVTEASMNMQGSDISIKLYQSHNIGQRVEIAAMGMTGYIITTPTEGWMYMPFQGQTKAEAMPAETIKEGSDLLDFQSPLLNYKEKGHQVELVGKEDVDGVECIKLKIKVKSGAEQTHFLDPATFYIIKTISKLKANGQEVEQAQTFSNYKKLESGYVFPFSFTGMGPGEITVKKIDVNVAVDASLFKVSK